MVPACQTASLMSKRAPDRAVLYQSAAGAGLVRFHPSQVPRDLAAGHHIRVSRKQTLQQGRAASTVTSNIDELRQFGFAER